MRFVEMTSDFMISLNMEWVMDWACDPLCGEWDCNIAVL